MVEIVYEMLSDREKSLIECCLDRIGNGANRIYIAPFDRVGRSGARLFRVFFCPDKDCYPHIVKIDRKDRIQREYENFQKIQNYLLPETTGAPREPIYESREAEEALGILYFQIVSDSNFDSARTLQLSDIIFDVSNDPDIEKERLDCLRNIFDRLYGICLSRTADTSNNEPTSVLLKDEFEWHISAIKRLNPRKKYGQIVGIEHIDEAMSTCAGANFANPVRLFEEISSGKGIWEEPVIRNLKHVHGDLHCNNIVLNSEKKPVLIDFAWAQLNADILKDFVLLENSIRVVMFPAYVNLDRHKEIDEFLLEEDGPLKARNLLTGDEPLFLHYVRLLEIVEIIRKYARRYGGKGYDWPQYLQSQFITMYRQLAYDTPNSIVGFRTLGMIGNRVKHEHQRS
ncbi:hypothetical protein [Breoghania sp. L-A4]|uniref:hypothetical protein n=1 Tax=Breoghania sp. L-A4 TaxID=2304600 RepID=UPI0013C305F8|nr:hypothetical protein [Breoghania sp. L-A4]